MQNVTLNNGVKMPIVGFGTFLIHGTECEESVLEAIKVGYRHIDTAEAYGNEEFVGNAINTCGVPREELFITTKVNFKSYEYETAKATVLRSLEKLQVEYLDLVLLHWPFGNYYAAYRALEDLYDEGKVKAIGISNFNPDRMIDLLNFNRVTPAVNQVETHLLSQQTELIDWMKKYNVQHEAYAPLGQGRKNEMFENPELVKVAQKHGKTPAQIALKFQIQRGIVVIPKTTNPSRMKENIDLFNFELSEDEINILKRLDKNDPMIGNPHLPTFVESAMNW
ncbi:aldo/keto reductase [Niallia taxi]|uniref:aldo/keto reductase n=1 Tax=Niallia taxi TaxID=2499688 RepID=UPI002E1E29CB|nr:aldo/keto reductase [Niallia taxi]